MIKFEKEINGIHFNVNFMDKLNVFKGASGTGKTFLFNTLCSYCMLQQIPYAFVDYNLASNGDEDTILTYCKGRELVILDNADLYLTPELFKNIKKSANTVIMSKKTTIGLDAGDAHWYMVDYTGDSLSTRRLF